MFKKGDTLRITEAAHPYSAFGFTDPSCIIPAAEYFVIVKRVTKTKNGPKVHYQGADHGAALLLQNQPEWRTIEKVEA